MRLRSGRIEKACGAGAGLARGGIGPLSPFLTSPARWCPGPAHEGVLAWSHGRKASTGHHYFPRREV